jgi:deoxyribonuclease-4
MSEDLLFGIAGIPPSSKPKTAQGGIERVAEMGLSCMEVQFGHGVNMNERMAQEVGELAKECNIKLTVHAPYYINLNAHEEEKVVNSQKMLVHSAQIASLLGAEAIIFHPAFYLKDPPKEVYDNVRQRLEETVRSLRDEGNHVVLRTETTGKGSQFGTLDEVMGLSADVDGVAPCIDFAHMHARTGKYNSYAEFVGTLNRIAEKLGWQALSHMHIHLSGIKYSAKGELQHMGLKDSDLQFVDVLQALKDLEVKGRIICESPDETREDDALLVMKTYNSL